MSVMKGVIRFRNKEKLSPRFIEPSKILEKVGDRALRLALPLNLLVVYLIFHVSMFK